MTAFTLGASPHRVTVLLTADADFFQDVTTADAEDWPIDFNLELRFDDEDDTVWTATVAGPVASWNVDKVDVNALIAGNPRHVRMFSGDANWANGTVSIRA